MAQCVTLNDVSAAGADARHYAPPHEQTDFSAGTPDTDATAAYTQELKQRLGFVAPGENEPAGAPIPKAVQAQSNTAAKLLTQVYQGLDNTRVQRADIADRLANTTSRVAAMWDRFTTSVSTWWQDAQAGFNLWASTYFNQPGVSEQMQILQSGKDLAVSQSHGLKQTWLGDLNKALQPIIAPIARSLGLSDMEAARLLGDFGTARHCIEANAALRSNWTEDLARLQQKFDSAGKDGMTAEELARMNKLPAWLHNQELTRNDLNPELRFSLAERKADIFHHSGMTDAQAMKRMNDIRNMVGPELAASLDEGADIISRLGFDRLLYERAQAGVVDPRQAAAFRNDYPEGNFVSLRAEGQVYSEAFNDASVFDPGTRYERDGMGFSSKDDAPQLFPQNAYDTALQNITRSAYEIAYNNFGYMLHEAQKVALDRGVDVGLEVLSKSQLQKQGLLSAFAYQGAVAYNRINPDGTLSKFYIRFKPGWEDTTNNTKLTGADLNGALFTEVKTPDGLAIATRVTSLFGQTFSRLPPLFAPKNMVRDVQERAVLMTSIDMYNTNGDRLAGTDIARRYVMNTARYGDIWVQNTLGTRPATGKMAERIEAYRRWGLESEFTRGMNEVRSVDLSAWRQNAQGSVLTKTFNQFGAKGRAALAELDKWNNAHNHVAPWTQFNTLLDLGVSERDAAAATLTLMNLYKTGRGTPLMRAIFPFVKPTVQSAANNLRALGFTYNSQTGRYGPSGGASAAVLGLAAAGSMIVPMVYSSLGNDKETGEPVIRSIPYSQMFGSIPIRLSDGDIFRAPLGFGLPSLVWGMVNGVERMYSGQDSAADVSGELLFQFVKQMAPGNWPEFKFTEKPTEYMMQLLFPSVVSPLVQIGMNTDRYGRPIKSAFLDERQAQALQGRISTPQAFHDAAQWFLRNTGLDSSPDSWNALAKGYFGSGPASVFRAIWNDSPRKTNATRSMTEGLEPFLGAFGASQWLGRVPEVSQTLFYNRKNQLEEALRKSGVKITSSEYNQKGVKNKTEARIAYQTGKLREAGFSDKDIRDWFLIEAAVKDLRERSAQLNEQWAGLLQNDSSEALKEAYKKYSEDAASIYTDTWNRIRR